MIDAMIWPSEIAEHDHAGRPDVGGVALGDAVVDDVGVQARQVQRRHRRDELEDQHAEQQPAILLQIAEEEFAEHGVSEEGRAMGRGDATVHPATNRRHAHASARASYAQGGTVRLSAGGGTPVACRRTTRSTSSSSPSPTTPLSGGPAPSTRPPSSWGFTDYGAYLDTSDSGTVAGFNAVADDQQQAMPLVVIYVDDLEAARERVSDAGGVILHDIYAFPGGRRFHFTDPAGNELAVWSE